MLGLSQRRFLAEKRLDIHTEASSSDVRLLTTPKEFPQLPKGLDRMHGNRLHTAGIDLAWVRRVIDLAVLPSPAPRGYARTLYAQLILVVKHQLSTCIELPFNLFGLVMVVVTVIMGAVNLTVEVIQPVSFSDSVSIGFVKLLRLLKKFCFPSMTNERVLSARGMLSTLMAARLQFYLFDHVASPAAQPLV